MLKTTQNKIGKEKLLHYFSRNRNMLSLITSFDQPTKWPISLIQQEVIMTKWGDERDDPETN